MSRKDDIKRLIVRKSRRLQILREQQATLGIRTPPEIITEIEDIENELMELQAELEQIKEEEEEEEQELMTRFRDILESIRSDPTLNTLVVGLERLANYHEILKEWKELHNLLQEIVVSFDPFVGEVDELYATNGKINRRLSRQWDNVKEMRIKLLVDFGRQIQYIGRPYDDDDPANLRGAPWVIQIGLAATELDSSLEKADLRSVFDSAKEFSSICNRQLFIADKKLKDLVEKLYNLSTGMLGRFDQ